MLKGTTEKSVNQEGGLLSIFLGPLINVGLPSIKNLLRPLTESVLLPLGLTTVAGSATDVAIQKKIYGSRMTSLTQLNVRYHEDS